MIATYELPSPREHSDAWAKLNRHARDEGLTLQGAIIRMIEGQGAKVLNCISEDFDKRWLVQVEHTGPLSIAGAPLQLTGE